MNALANFRWVEHGFLTNKLSAQSALQYKSKKRSLYDLLWNIYRCKFKSLQSVLTPSLTVSGAIILLTAKCHSYRLWEVDAWYSRLAMWSAQLPSALESSFSKGNASYRIFHHESLVNTCRVDTRWFNKLTNWSCLRVSPRIATSSDHIVALKGLRLASHTITVMDTFCLLGQTPGVRRQAYATCQSELVGLLQPFAFLCCSKAMPWKSYTTRQAFSQYCEGKKRFMQRKLQRWKQSQQNSL